MSEIPNPSRSSGKFHRLQAAASPAGVFRILALDHRGVLLKMMSRAHGSPITPDRVTRLKLDVVRRIGPLATAVILDPEYSAFEALASGALPGGVALLTPLDLDHPMARSNASERSRPTWTVRQARELGASGVKLYLPYHPDAGDLTAAKDDLVREAVARCAQESLPLFLEPVACPRDPHAPVDPAAFARERRDIIVKTVERLAALGPDVLKIPFPVDGRLEPDLAVWRQACQELDSLSTVPWTLLSAGDPFPMFKAQLRIACQSGCSGFMAGRSLWSEAALAEDAERGSLLQHTILPRMQELNDVADRHARDWRGRWKGPGSPAITRGRDETPAPDRCREALSREEQ